MTTVIEILLERGGLLGALLVIAGWTIALLYRDLNRERTAYQQALQAKDSAAAIREAHLQDELRALHEKHKEDQRRATEAMQSLNDRVHAAVDRVADLLEHSKRDPSRRPPQLPPWVTTSTTPKKPPR